MTASFARWPNPLNADVTCDTVGTPEEGWTSLVIGKLNPPTLYHQHSHRRQVTSVEPNGLIVEIELHEEPLGITGLDLRLSAEQNNRLPL